MIVWTNQPYSVYEQLMATGSFSCTPALAINLNDGFDDFARAYAWMIKQMKRRIGQPPAGVTTPIWAWYRMNFQHRRPDFRMDRDFDDQVCMEIEIDEAQILLSDFENWNFVLNDWYLAKVSNEDDWNRQEAWFDQLPAAHQTRVKERSWQRIFDITPAHGDWTRNGDCVQGCFWQLNRNQVRRAWRLRKGKRMVELGVPTLSK